MDIRLKVKGGGQVSQVYAVRQAIGKAIVAFYAKNVDAASALDLKKTLVAYDRTLLIADPRRMEPKSAFCVSLLSSLSPPVIHLFEVAFLGADRLTDSHPMLHVLPPCVLVLVSVVSIVSVFPPASLVATLRVRWTRSPRSCPEVVPCVVLFLLALLMGASCSITPLTPSG